MNMRYFFALALCLAISWSARAMADEAAPTAKDDADKPAAAADDAEIRRSQTGD